MQGHYSTLGPQEVIRDPSSCKKFGLQEVSNQGRSGLTMSNQVSSALRKPQIMLKDESRAPCQDRHLKASHGAAVRLFGIEDSLLTTW